MEQLELKNGVAGEASRGGRVVSLRDVAREAKVSVATVSMAINGHPRISRATSTRIQRLVDRMGYQPNRLAQSLSSKHTNVVAIMLPALRHAFADAYFGEVISGVCDKAGKMGYKVMLEQAKPDFIKEKQHVRIFERRYVDGVLCLGMNDRHRWLGDFQQAGCPAMLVDNALDDGKMDSVHCDYASGAEQVMNYLLQLGHRKIGLITAAPQIKTARLVRRMYEQMQRHHDIRPDESQVVDGEFTEEGGAAAARQLIEKHPDMTAIFAGNDKMAIGAMHQLSVLGLNVPRDVSVVGFDDLRHAAFVNPTLTTIHLPLYEVGSMAMERLVERIHGRAEPVAEVLRTHLVVRQSTAMAKSTEPPVQ
ncbi:MAG: LacI family DNA-binding transcriptional regulator [Tepidisphaeraceae bacterium]